MNLISLKRKLALGTVQLGLPYGINNKVGKPDKDEAGQILEKADLEGITILDSAEAYGDSLRVIGTYLRKSNNCNFRVVSKFIGNDEGLEIKLDKTLGLIGQSDLYVFMYHRFSDYESGKYANELLALKEKGKIQKLGLSLYSEDELKRALDDMAISVIQIPFNPFDASEEKKKILAYAKSNGKEIHVRSIFLQGLIFKEVAELSGNLKGWAKPISEFRKIVEGYGLNVREACLNYALHQSFIDYVIVGIETKTQLEENLAAVRANIPGNIFDNFQNLTVPEKALLNPSNWRP